MTMQIIFWSRWTLFWRALCTVFHFSGVFNVVLVPLIIYSDYLIENWTFGFFLVTNFGGTGNTRGESQQPTSASIVQVRMLWTMCKMWAQMKNVKGKHSKWFLRRKYFILHVWKDNCVGHTMQFIFSNVQLKYFLRNHFVLFFFFLHIWRICFCC